MKRINSILFVKIFLLVCLAIIITCSFMLNLTTISAGAFMFFIFIACLSTKDKHAAHCPCDQCCYPEPRREES